MPRLFLLGLARLLAIMLVASFLGALLLRAAPGFSSDEREMSGGLSSQSIQAIRQEHLAQANIPRFYAQYLRSLMHGDLGNSLSLNQPVRALLDQRLLVTLRALGFGSNERNSHLHPSRCAGLDFRSFASAAFVGRGASSFSQDLPLLQQSVA